MAWKQGQSGNPKGRPPKSRALTDLLEKSGSKKMKLLGKNISAKQQFVDRLWEGLATGVMTFALPDGVEGPAYTIALGSNDYIAMAKLVFGQIDGPPKGELDLDLTSNGKDVGIVFGYKPPRSESEQQVDEALVQLAAG